MQNEKKIESNDKKEEEINESLTNIQFKIKNRFFLHSFKQNRKMNINYVEYKSVNR